ncbi:hypothetical protein Tco_0685968 [Tanacetum coccineum]
MYNKKNIDYVALLWEDFMYQANNREISLARKEHMPYHSFTKVIINHFISKDKIISMRNRINLYTIRDDSLLGTLKFVSKTQDYHQYGALIPDDMINQDIKDSQAYKTYYYFATGKVPPRKARKYNKVASPLRKLSLVKEAEPIKKAKRVKRPTKKSTTASTAGVVLRDTPCVSVSKKKALAKADRSKATTKDTSTDEGTGTISGVPDVPKYKSKSDDESWGDSEGDNKNDSEDDNNDDVSKGDDDEADSDDDDGDDAHNSERTDSGDDDENPSFTLKDYDEEEHDEEYESDDNNENVFEEKDDDDLYKDVDPYKQVVEDAHVTLTALQKTDDSKQSSFVSSDFANQFLILEKSPPSDHEVASLMNINMSHEVPSTQIPSPLTEPTTVIPDSSTIVSTIVPPTISMISPLPQLTTPTPAPTTASTTISITALPNFSSLFEERKLYIEVVEKSVKDIIKDEVKSLLPQILPKEVSDFATPMIQSTITESLENVVLVKSTYESAASLREFELKKILLDKLKKSKLYRAAEDLKNLYEALIKSYQLDKDFFDSYGKAYSLKRSRDDKDEDKDPLAGSNKWLKKKKASKDVEPLRGSKLKESKTSSSKGTKSQPKSSGKSVQTEEPLFETVDTEMPQDQGGDVKDQPNVEVTPMDDWFKKPNKPSTPNRPWNNGKYIDSRPPHKWISNIAKATQPPSMFDELMSTPTDFSAYVMHNLKINNLKQEILVGQAFNLLKGTCKSFVELKYHFEECYKAVTDQLDWNNPKGHEYPFDLSKLLPLIEAQGRQMVPADYFFNNDLEYLKGESSSRKYTTSTTKTKAAKYDNIKGIKDMVLKLWSPVKVAYDKFATKRIIAVPHVKVIKWYGYGYLEDIIVRREDQTLNKFKEGYFPRLNLRDIEDLLLLLVQNKLSNLEQDVIFDLNIALRMFTRRIVILKRVEDLQLGVESYQKKLNITKPKTFRFDISKLTLYTFYDGTLTFVRRVLHDIANNWRMDYLPKRRWSNLDIKRSCIMIQAINQQLFERRLMRNLEKFVGGREYGNDFRLLERMI